MGVGKEGRGRSPPPLSGEGGCYAPLLWTSPSRRLHLIYFDFKSRPHFKIASLTYICVCISRDIHARGEASKH